MLVRLTPQRGGDGTILLFRRQRSWLGEYICEQLCALRPESKLGVRVWDDLYTFQCYLAHGAKSADCAFHLHLLRLATCGIDSEDPQTLVVIECNNDACNADELNRVIEVEQ